MPFRLIPRLDIKGPNLVKGIHLEGLRVLGHPEDFAQKYYEDGADELFYMDTVASLYGRNSLLEIVEKTSRHVFIPLCVGGGIRSIEDIRQVLRAGADKVAINTAAHLRPEIIKEAAEEFGSSTIVVTIEAIRQKNGTHLCFTNCGREPTGVEAVSWAKRVAEMGVGEIVVTSVDQEGTGRGFDIELTRHIADAVSVPVIAHGGAGSTKDIVEVIREGRCDAIALGSMLHYNAVREIPIAIEEFGDEGNIEFLRNNRHSGFKLVQDKSILEIRADLTTRGVVLDEL